MVPLRGGSRLLPPAADSRWRDAELEAVGVGPDDCMWGLWRAPDGAAVATWYREGQRGTDGFVELRSPPAGAQSQIQPLPGGRVLTAAWNGRGAGPNAHVWSASGNLERSANLGHAIRHVLTDEAGAVWVGYFDEHMGEPDPSGRGLARFTDQLAIDWLYPADLPHIFDCYSLNVGKRKVWSYAYTDFHLVELQGDRGRDLGEAPTRYASAVMVADDRCATVGGTLAEYDLVTPFVIGSSGLEQAGAGARLVLLTTLR